MIHRSVEAWKAERLSLKHVPKFLGRNLILARPCQRRSGKGRSSLKVAGDCCVQRMARLQSLRGGSSLGNAVAWLAGVEGSNRFEWVLALAMRWCCDLKQVSASAAALIGDGSSDGKPCCRSPSGSQKTARLRGLCQSGGQTLCHPSGCQWGTGSLGCRSTGRLGGEVGGGERGKMEGESRWLI
jgi:hypothetical protein